MSIALKNLNPKKDAFLIQEFAKNVSEGGEGAHDNDKEHNHSQPLNTIEADINIILSHPTSDRTDLFYNDNYIQHMNSELGACKPWLKDPNYFQHVHVSSLALLKMTIHARSGGSIEIMGMLTGRIVKNGIVVMDVYPLPVEGTETRVNAQAEGYEFMVQYLESLKKSGRYENIVGWYHSHPGYGCWLSGIDVATQSLNQQFQDPYLAIVVDPERTMSNGKVEIGAFRTYTEDYVNSNKLGTGSNPTTFATSPFAKRNEPKRLRDRKIDNIPSEKAQDFGLHSSKYYSLSVEVFRSRMDYLILKNLWNKFWINTLLGPTDEQNFIGEISGATEAFVGDKLEHFSGRVQQLKNSEPNPTAVSRVRPVENGRDNNPLASILQAVANRPESQKVFTLRRPKAKLIEKSKDSDESDSEMNDDSDIDARNLQEDLEDEMQSSNSGVDVETGFKFLRDSRKNLTGLSVASPTQPNLIKLSNHPGAAGSSHMKSESNDDKKVRASAAEASRNLVTLKLQEILFLNE